MQNYSILRSLNILSNIIEGVFIALITTYVIATMVAERAKPYIMQAIKMAHYVYTHRRQLLTKLSYQFDDAVTTANKYRNLIGSQFTLDGV